MNESLAFGEYYRGSDSALALGVLEVPLKRVTARAHERLRRRLRVERYGREALEFQCFKAWKMAIEILRSHKKARKV
ncbi:MAG TPA: hypothetical protein VMW38_17085 [Terriglobia bacterium]|nr:hypothetical protein [Terriglobia bacterium]